MNAERFLKTLKRMCNGEVPTFCGTGDTLDKDCKKCWNRPLSEVE